MSHLDLSERWRRLGYPALDVGDGVRLSEGDLERLWKLTEKQAATLDAHLTAREQAESERREQQDKLDAEARARRGERLDLNDETDPNAVRVRDERAGNAEIVRREAAPPTLADMRVLFADQTRAIVDALKGRRA